MKFDKYQLAAAKYDLGTLTNRADDPSLMDKILGLVGESGEAADKFKKIIRDKQGKIGHDDREEIAKELGDVLWYIATIARYLDIPLDDIATQNLEKLESRRARGKLSGSGDNR